MTPSRVTSPSATTRFAVPSGVVLTGTTTGLDGWAALASSRAVPAPTRDVGAASELVGAGDPEALGRCRQGGLESALAIVAGAVWPRRGCHDLTAPGRDEEADADADETTSGTISARLLRRGRRASRAADGALSRERGSVRRSSAGRAGPRNVWS